MIAVANLLPDRTQCFYFTLHFFFQELLPPPQLLFEDSGPRLPGQRHPREKGRPLPLRRPFLAVERSRQSAAPLRGGRENAALRPGRRIRVLGSANQALPLQLLQRIVDLRTRNARPVPHLPPLQFQVCLVPVHGTLSEQAQQNQVRRGQFTFLSGGHRALSAYGSNTTTGAFPEEASDPSPAPPLPETHPDSRCPALSRS